MPVGEFSSMGSSSKCLIHSIRASPKSSLADLHSIQLKKVSQERKKKLYFSKKTDKESRASTKKVKE